MNIIFISALWIISFKAIIKSKMNTPSGALILTWLSISIINNLFNFYEISFKTQAIILIAIISLIIGESLGLKIKTKASNYFICENKLNYTINACIIFLIILFPFYIQAVLAPSGYDLTNVLAIRDSMTNSYNDGELNPIISIGINLSIVFSFFFACHTEKMPYKKALLYLISSSYVFLSFSKGYILQIIIYCALALILTRKVSKKLVSIIAIASASIIIILFSIRDSHVESSILFKIYTLSPTAAFDKIVNQDFTLNKPEIFLLEPVYTLLGIAEKNIKPTTWVDVEVPTNVYTSFAFLYNDTGILGIIIFYILIGFITKTIININERNPNPTLVFIIVWSYYAAIFSFFSDGYIGLLKTNIQYLIILFVMSQVIKSKLQK